MCICIIAQVLHDLINHITPSYFQIKGTTHLGVGDLCSLCYTTGQLIILNTVGINTHIKYILNLAMKPTQMESLGYPCYPNIWNHRATEGEN